MDVNSYIRVNISFSIMTTEDILYIVATCMRSTAIAALICNETRKCVVTFADIDLL